MQEELQDIYERHRQTGEEMEDLIRKLDVQEAQLRAAQEKNSHYENVISDITKKLCDFTKFQSEHYEEGKRRITRMLNTLMRAQPNSGGGHVRTLSEGSIYYRRLHLQESQHSQMSQHLRPYSSAYALKEATEEETQESGYPQPQDSVHQHQTNGSAVSIHDTSPFPEITSKRQSVVSPTRNFSFSDTSTILPGSLLEDDTSAIKDVPKSPPASSPDGPGRDDGTRRRTSSGKDSGSTKNRSTPGAKPGSVYAQSVVPKKTK